MNTISEMIRQVNAINRILPLLHPGLNNTRDVIEKMILQKLNEAKDHCIQFNPDDHQLSISYIQTPLYDEFGKRRKPNEDEMESIYNSCEVMKGLTVAIFKVPL